MNSEEIFPESGKDQQKNTLRDISEIMDVNHNDTRD
jgi:hypothetical protein